MRVTQLGLNITATGLEACLRDGRHSRGARISALPSNVTDAVRDALARLRVEPPFEAAIASNPPGDFISFLDRVEPLLRRAGAVAIYAAQSDGTLAEPAVVRREPMRTALSSPACGVIAAAQVAREVGLSRFVTLDIDSNTVRVCRCDPRPEMMTEWIMSDGQKVGLRAFAIHTIPREQIFSLDTPSRWLVAFGSAAAKHAGKIAQQINASGVIIPVDHAALSATGLVQAPIVWEHAAQSEPEASQSEPGALATGLSGDLASVRTAFGRLMDAAAETVFRAGYDLDDTICERLVELRYAGDHESLTIPVESLTDVGRLLAPFHAEQARRHNRNDANRPVEVTALRIRTVLERPPLQRARCVRDGTFPNLAGITIPAGWICAVEPLGHVRMTRR